ncbi:MAG: hypothetical protein GC188_13525 [Alphaproteobacteria bacterium]|nr:hypothetical protein [Alphaproteobacteria bacterium]
MDFKSFDMGVLKKLADPKLAGDLNAFLEKMPERAGHTILIAAGIAWAVAAAASMFATIKVQQLTELRNSVKEAQALVPIVPKISDKPISPEEVKTFAEEAGKAYKDLNIVANGSSIIITAPSTSLYGQFREAVGHVQNGGSGWRVSLQKLCVGRECDKNAQLAASLTINKVSVENPPPSGG